MKRKAVAVFTAICVLMGTTATGCNKSRETSGEATHTVRKLTHASVSSTREFFVAYNDLFAEYWLEKNGEELEVEMSHRGSGLQTEEILDNQAADVITLAGANDMEQLKEKKIVAEQWEKALKNESVPYTSPVVFLVREDSKKDIKDWNDLTEEGVEIMTPNPETSGGGVWNFLAAWAYAQQMSNGDEKIAGNFMKRFYENVLIMYDDSREAVINFVENGQGDVLVTWESEACLSLEAYPDDYKMIIPSVSVLGQPVAAVSQSVAKKNGNTDIAKEYLEYLYSEEGQRLAGEHFLRPVREEIFQEFRGQFKTDGNLKTIEEMGGWDSVWEECFEKDGVWEQVRPKE